MTICCLMWGNVLPQFFNLHSQQNVKIIEHVEHNEGRNFNL
jgi:hypothetical protein